MAKRQLPTPNKAAMLANLAEYKAKARASEINGNDDTIWHQYAARIEAALAKTEKDNGKS